MVLVFKDKKGKKKIIGYPRSQSHAFTIMTDYCLNNNLKVKYYRMTTRDKGNGLIITTFDFGSHTEFFYMADSKYEKELMKK